MAKLGYVAGDPWCICGICGYMKHYSQTKIMYTGLRVCAEEWNAKPLQDYAKYPVFPHELQPKAHPSPEPDIIFRDTTLLPDWQHLRT